MVMVEDLDGWWRHIAALDLASRYGVRPPTPPEIKPWGLREVNVIDLDACHPGPLPMQQTAR